MEVKFRNWLIESGNDSAASIYPELIYRLSSHYTEQTGESINIYELKGDRPLKNILKLYGANGKFSDIGKEQDGNVKSALSHYVKFNSQQVAKGQNKILMEAIEEYSIYSNANELKRYKNQVLDYCSEQLTSVSSETQMIKLNSCSMNFSYEKDLQQTLCVHVSELFPDYDLFSGAGVGIEYQIDSRRIDVLLERRSDKSLLIVELKTGLADYKVFGQISMYMGLIKRKFSDRLIEGVIIAGEIDQSLVQAAETNNAIKLMTYQLSIKLNEV